MSQATNLVTGVPQSPPFTKTDVAALLKALATQHSGTVRPAVLTAEGEGTWLKKVSSTAWELYHFDGSNDILLGTINPTAHSWNPQQAQTTAVTLVNGANNDVASPATNRVRISGPSAGFSISGFAGGVDGRRLSIYNSTSQAMTITNQGGSSAAANRISTLTGSDLVLAARTSFVTLSYDGAASRWILENYV